MSELGKIDTAQAKALLDAGQAMLIDIRESDEHAREHIIGSRSVPLSGFDASDFAGQRDKVAIVHCASGSRTAQAAPRILMKGFREVYQLEGGLAAWKAAGLPVHLDRRAPISLQRQVQLVAGSLVLLGVLLGVLVTPWFLLLSAFVGSGLAFAGLSGTCALARLLVLLPYNRRATGAAV